MKVVVGVLCLAAVLGSAVAQRKTYKTKQDKYLTEQATGNFACRVNSVQVTTESPGDGSGAVSVEHVRAAFQSVSTLEWAHATQMSFSPMDGRNSEKVLATPGGDMGEFIQAVQSYATVGGVALSQADVTGMLTKYLKTMTREKFTYETDEKAYTKLIIASGCRNLKISQMQGMRRKRNAVISNIDTPSFIGDPFIRFLASNATDLDMDPLYVKMGLTAYHEVLWTGTESIASKLCYLQVKGPHREAALVDVQVPPYCIDQGLAPMVSQQMTCSAPVYVQHSDVVKLLRRELVATLTEGQTVNPRDMLATFNRLAENNFNAWWGSVGEDKARYTVTFSLSNKEKEA